jgi:hypothetical protein
VLSLAILTKFPISLQGKTVGLGHREADQKMELGCTYQNQAKLERIYHENLNESDATSRGSHWVLIGL